MLMNVLAFTATLAATLAVCFPICYLYLLWTEGHLGKVIRDWFRPPRTRIRVIGPGGDDNVFFEGEEQAVKSMLAQIPRSQRKGWRIERIEPER